MEFNDFLYKMRGIDPDAKKAYLSLFNSSSTRTRGNKVLDDLKVHFRFYGAKPTNDPIVLAKQAAYREVIEYIMTMAARISHDTLTEIEAFINEGGSHE